MKRWRSLTTALLALGVVVGCDRDGDGPFGPTIDRAAVGGVYHLTALTFDVLGSQPEKDIMERLSQADLPELSISRSEDAFQLLYRDPASGDFRLETGSYTLLETGIRLKFKSAEAAQRLLFPERLELTFDEAEGTLFYEGRVDASLTRLRALVPEFAEEQLPDPVVGELMVLFSLDRR